LASHENLENFQEESIPRKEAELGDAHTTEKIAAVSCMDATTRYLYGNVCFQ